jgi:3-oxoadipate enol-lactonase
VGFVILAHEDDGDGQPVVLLHSGVTDRGMWDPLVTPLGHTFRVIRPDLRGFGESPVPGGPYADCDDVDALLEHLGVRGAAVVGSSFGGRVAMELAVRHPGRVSSLVLLCPAWRGLEVTDPQLLAFGEQEDQLLEAGDVDAAAALNARAWLGPEAAEAARSEVVRMQRRAFDVQRAADALEPAPEPERVPVDPSEITVPTTVVCGSHDFAHFRDVARALAEQIPGADLVELPWAGHLPSLERPDAVLALLLDVLRDDRDVHRP